MKGINEKAGADGARHYFFPGPLVLIIVHFIPYSLRFQIGGIDIINLLDDESLVLIIDNLGQRCRDCMVRSC